MMTDRIVRGGFRECEATQMETPIAVMTVQDRLRQLDNAMTQLNEAIGELEKRLDPIVMRVPISSSPDTGGAEPSDSQLGAALVEMRERIQFMRDKVFGLLTTVQI